MIEASSSAPVVQAAAFCGLVAFVIFALLLARGDKDPK